jgi:hypothetical protein
MLFSGLMQRQNLVYSRAFLKEIKLVPSSLSSEFPFSQTYLSRKGTPLKSSSA